MIDNERARLDMRIGSLEQDVHDLKRELQQLRELVRNVRFFPSSAGTGDPRPSENLARPVPGESPRCPTFATAVGAPAIGARRVERDLLAEHEAELRERETDRRLRALGDLYAARVEAGAVAHIGAENVEATVARIVAEPTRSLPTAREAVPHWHEFVGEQAPRVDETLRIPVALLQVPVPAPRDGLCRCERSRDPHAPTWCGTLPRAAGRP